MPYTKHVNTTTGRPLPHPGPRRHARAPTRRWQRPGPGGAARAAAAAIVDVCCRRGGWGGGGKWADDPPRPPAQGARGQGREPVSRHDPRHAAGACVGICVCGPPRPPLTSRHQYHDDEMLDVRITHRWSTASIRRTPASGTSTSPPRRSRRRWRRVPCMEKEGSRRVVVVDAI